MAYVANDPNQVQDPNDPNKQQNVGNVAGQGTTIGSGGTTSSGDAGGPITGNSGSGPAGTSSGSFTNLNNYVTANKGNDGALGGAVANTVGTAAKGADQQGQAFQQAGQAKIDSATVREDPNVMYGLSALGDGKASDVDQAALKNQWNATYGGPKQAADLDNYAGTNQAYQNVQDLGQEAASDNVGGRQNLLNQTYGAKGQQYSNGERNLDSFVLGAGDQGSQALKDINSQYGNYTNNFQNINGLIGKSIQSAQDTTKQTAANTQQAANNAFGNVEGRLSSAQAQARAADQAAQDRYAALQRGEGLGLSSAAMTKFGTKGLVTGPSGAHTVADFANAPDVSNYQKLQQLIAGASGNSPQAKFAADQLQAGNFSGPVVNQELVNNDNALASVKQSFMPLRLTSTPQPQASPAPQAPAPQQPAATAAPEAHEWSSGESSGTYYGDPSFVQGAAAHGGMVMPKEHSFDKLSSLIAAARKAK